MIASAPGKVILFGEHAVVYGRHAVVSAINLRCYAKAEKASDITIESPLGKTSLDFKVHPYVSYAIKRFSEIRPVKGVYLKIWSDIPIASGLGSSSAVTVAVLKSLDLLFETNLSNEEIFELARKVELDVQGIGSGTDPFVSTFGGTWLIPERERIDIGDYLDLTVIYTGKASITSDMVRKVANLREMYGDVIERIFDAIDSISLRSISALKDRDFEALSFLVRTNQLLLKALGVSCREIDEIVNKLENLGIPAKITGAGGGGSVIALGSVDLDGYKCLSVSLNAEGVREEKV
ncbi:mevalonate kinase [Archaeoglobus profundus]|uniref:Mevalonate kinase n=1 Tax=Archaeoglobus profundus (strain DSM 5631 / JCM 9629 / NBRC 100127 / Av18) TaxID=572546 RepID=D2RD66_ARCPA|nr:mevalonate kinase [Archaeoglobus profundus]ADB58060.1 mevalonate kinase [Archaeoglobus profundus DSM 5631]